MASQEVGLANGPEVVGREISAAQNVVLAFGRTDLPTLRGNGTCSTSRQTIIFLVGRIIPTKNGANNYSIYIGFIYSMVPDCAQGENKNIMVKLCKTTA